jgi:hypothetical protein
MAQDTLKVRAFVQESLLKEKAAYEETSTNLLGSNNGSVSLWAVDNEILLGGSVLFRIPFYIL